MARPLISQQLVALAAAALEAAHGVAAEVVAAGVVDQALVDVCGSQAGRGGEDGLGPQGGDHGPAPALPRLPASHCPGLSSGPPTGPGMRAPRWGQEDGLRHLPPPQGLSEPGVRGTEGRGTSAVTGKTAGTMASTTCFQQHIPGSGLEGGEAWAGQAASQWLRP